eukprot:766591-Hanusia_phi.AAC.6
MTSSQLDVRDTRMDVPNCLFLAPKEFSLPHSSSNSRQVCFFLSTAMDPHQCRLEQSASDRQQRGHRASLARYVVQALTCLHAERMIKMLYFQQSAPRNLTSTCLTSVVDIS